MLVTYAMPPEAESWKQSVAMWGMTVVAVVAIGRLIWSCFRQRSSSAGSSLLIAIAMLVGLLVLLRSLHFDDALESSSATSRVMGMTNVVPILVMCVTVTVVTAGMKDAGKRCAVAIVGGVIVCWWMFSWTLTLMGARVVARRFQCKANAKDIGASLLQMAKETGGLPEASIEAEGGARSWRVELLDWTSEKSLKNQYLDLHPWNHTANEPIARTDSRIYSCPCNDSTRDETGRVLTDFAAVTGPGTLWSNEHRGKFPNVPDGASTTLLIVEASGQRIVWTEPRDVDVSAAPIGVNLDGNKRGESPGLASGYHAGGCHATFADGRATFLSKSIEPSVLKAMTTAGAGDVVDDF